METCSLPISRTAQTRLLLATAMLLSLRAFGQGIVSFSNLGLGANVIMGIPITVGTTTYAIGSKAPPGTIFSVALYWSPFDPATPDGPATVFSQVGPTGHISPAAGVYNVGSVTIPGVTPPGGLAWLEVKGWATACGSTYEEALNRGDAILGNSSFFLLRTGDPTIGGTPPSLGFGNGGLVLIGGVGGNQPSLCVPEPSAVALVFVGALVLL